MSNKSDFTVPPDGETCPITHCQYKPKEPGTERSAVPGLTTHGDAESQAVIR